MSTVSQEQLHNDVILAHDAVRFVKALLALHPLSQRIPAAIPPTLVSTVSQSGDQAMKDGSTKQQTAGAALPQVQAAQRWPTPKPNEWEEIQLVFVRACCSLTYALGLLARNVLKETVQQLIGHLGPVMQLLAGGHMPDMDIDMCRLFASGLPPVLSAQCAEHLGYSGLTTAMLSRVGKDSSLLPQSLEHSAQICSLFRELYQHHCALPFFWIESQSHAWQLDVCTVWMSADMWHSCQCLLSIDVIITYINLQ